MTAKRLWWVLAVGWLLLAVGLLVNPVYFGSLVLRSIPAVVFMSILAIIVQIVRWFREREG